MDTAFHFLEYPIHNLQHSLCATIIHMHSKPSLFLSDLEHLCEAHAAFTGVNRIFSFFSGGCVFNLVLHMCEWLLLALSFFFCFAPSPEPFVAVTLHTFSSALQALSSFCAFSLALSSTFFVCSAFCLWSLSLLHLLFSLFLFFCSFRSASCFSSFLSLQHC